MPALAPNQQDVADRVFDELRGGKSIRVHGPSGSGRTTLTDKLRRFSELLVVELLPPGEVDCAAVAMVEARASLPENQRPESDPGVLDYGHAGRQLAQAAREQGRWLVLRLPTGWGNLVAGVPLESKEYHEGEPRKHAVDWLRGLLAAGEAVAVVGDEPLGWLAGVGPQAEEICLRPHQIPLEEMASIGWGTYRSAFDSLQRSVQPEQRATPVDWRLAVGLVALGEPSDRVQRLLVRAVPIASLASQMAQRLRAHPALSEAVKGLLCARRALSQAEVMTVCEPPLEHRPLFDQCLAYGDGEQLRVAPAVRMHLQRELGPLDGSPGLHDRLMKVHRAHDGATSPASLGFLQARAWCEKVHHAAHGTDQEEWERQELAGPEQYWERGRALSLRADFEGAARVFLSCTLEYPTDDYGWHYLGYNLKKAGGEASAINAAYRQAIDLAPANSWWNSRLVTSLIEANQLGLARQEWRDAVKRVDPDGERLRADAWLAEHFHRRIAESWLAAGRPDLAAEVMEEIPEQILLQSDKLRELRAKVEDPAPREPAESQVVSLLEELERLVREDRRQKALIRVLAVGKQLLAGEDRATCELLLERADMDRLGVELSLGLLAALLPLKAQGSQARAKFASRLREKLSSDRPSEVEALLRGLE